MKNGIRCDQGKICNNGICSPGTVQLSSKHYHTLSHSRQLLGLGDTTYTWVHECVGSKNTSRCKGSDNTYDATGEECGCEVNNPIRYQWGEPTDRCNCDGASTDDAPCLVPDSHCGCTKPTYNFQAPCDAPKECYLWESNQECTECGGGLQAVEVQCFNIADGIHDYENPEPDSKCAHLPKPPTE
jgi:hypothetical protein